ncbi:MAG TPA: hypothetical protein VH853_07455 [Polyangia bacterium]|jgi:hypothetical protein|nr:hypothetical protein [Polyangia bacterium]
MTAIQSEAATVSSPLGAGAAALRRFWRPFVLIQASAALLAIAYRTSESFRAACAVGAGWKSSGGLPFAAATGALAGGVLPELAKLLADAKRSAWRGRGGEILFNIVFFAFNGVVIDLLYSGEARLFGRDAQVRTIVEKLAFDQFVFSPLWLIVIVLLFLWRQRGYAVAATLPALHRGFYRARVLPLLIPNWLFWIPMVSIIYALPVALQFLLFVPALGAWSLIMVFIADR